MSATHKKRKEGDQGTRVFELRGFANKKQLEGFLSGVKALLEKLGIEFTGGDPIDGSGLFLVREGRVIRRVEIHLYQTEPRKKS